MKLVQGLSTSKLKLGSVAEVVEGTGVVGTPVLRHGLILTAMTPRRYPIEKDSGVVCGECIFAVVSTWFSEQLTGGARAQQPEMELS